MDSDSQKSLISHVVDAIGSLLTSLLVFAATPVVLVTVVGYPLGNGLGHRWDHATRIALTGVVLIAWVAWFACSTQLIRSVIAQVRRGHINSPVGAVLTDRVAARIAGGVLSLIAVLTPLFVASEAGASNPGAVQTVGLGTVRSDAPVAAAPLLPVAVLPVQQVEGAAYVVHPGDSLWSIAETQLGDGGDWPAIAALNLGRTMPDGLRFVDPSLIRAGWTLQMPDEGAAAPLASVSIVLPTSAPTPIPVIAPTPTGAGWRWPGPTRSTTQGGQALSVSLRRRA